MSILAIIFYILSFLALYVQVFLLVTYFERRREIVIRKDNITLDIYPSVTIIVPCYNEEDTVLKTIDSLLELDYPKTNLKIIVVDDGSKDSTWEILQGINNPLVSVFHKENGGKHTALNLGLTHTTSEFVGCLDADSSVHPEALKRIMTFFDNQATMAVAPSIVVRDPKNIIQYAQRAEYDMAHYNKKMLAFLGGIHVTPGPFSIFRKSVFDELGPYRKAHHTEDQEIALRMQEKGYKIDHAPDAYVYTGSPNSIPKLYRQRVRWIYGFIRNAFDYRKLIFRPEYGTIGIFTLPSGIISITGTMFLLIYMLAEIYQFVERKILQIQSIGIHNTGNVFSFNLFYFDTRIFIFISLLLYAMVIIGLINGRRMIYGRGVLVWDIPLFIIIYAVIAPFWLAKAVWNAVNSEEASWTSERDYSLAEK